MSNAAEDGKLGLIYVCTKQMVCIKLGCFYSKLCSKLHFSCALIQFIEVVDSKRAALGAIQNRMESTIRNQSSIAENESDARSRIRDTDFASETAALTQNQIIQQASQTILSQANQRPTVALSLLGR